MATKAEETAQGAVAEVQAKGGEVLSTAQEQVTVKAGEVRDDAVFQIREQVAERSTRAGEQIEAVAQALRSSGQTLRTDDKAPAADLVENLAKRAEHLGGYLRSSDPDRLLDDVERFARNKPWLMAGCAALAGFAASRLVKASSDRRYQTRRGSALPAYGDTRIAVPSNR